MQRRIQTNWPLREALRSPLLLNLYPQAFATLPAPPGAAELSSADTVEARREALFAAYVAAVFVSTAQAAGAKKDGARLKEKSLRWLPFLANRMQQAGKSLFFVEEMQPTWLPHPLIRRYRGLYGLLLGLTSGLSFGLASGLREGLSGGLISG